MKRASAADSHHNLIARRDALMVRSSQDESADHSSSGDNVIASGVTEAFADLNSANQTCIGDIAGGVAHYRGPAGTTTPFTSVPAGSKPVGRNVFLAPNGDLYENNAVVASGVSSAATRFNSANTAIIGYASSPSC